MTYSPIQLDIIRTFGSKELSEGCLINTDKWIKNLDDHFIIWTDNKLYRESRNGNEPYLYSQTCEILWHRPELFPDVARAAKEKNMWIEVMLHRYSKTWHILSINKWTEYHRIEYNPTLSLLDQSEETLTQLLLPVI